jgi:hypothetical protein
MYAPVAERLGVQEPSGHHTTVSARCILLIVGERVKRLLVVGAVMGAAACEGNSTGPSNSSGTGSSSSGSAPTSALSATIDGVEYHPTRVTAQYFDGAQESSLKVGAVDAVSADFTFDLVPGPRQFVTTGTYQVGSSAMSAMYYHPGEAISVAAAGTGSGTVTVTTFSRTTKTASGTFSFVLKGNSGTKTVTNGAFNVTFQ